MNTGVKTILFNSCGTCRRIPAAKSIFDNILISSNTYDTNNFIQYNKLTKSKLFTKNGFEYVGNSIRISAVE